MANEEETRLERFRERVKLFMGHFSSDRLFSAIRYIETFAVNGGFALIAGSMVLGAIRRFHSADGDEFDGGDLDIFVRGNVEAYSPSDKRWPREMSISKFLESALAHEGWLRESGPKRERESKYIAMEREIDEVINLISGSRRIQLIKVMESRDQQQVLDGFDLSFCAIGFSGGRLIGRYINEAAAGFGYFQKRQPAKKGRLEKYRRRGFVVCAIEICWCTPSISYPLIYRREKGLKRLRENLRTLKEMPENY